MEESDEPDQPISAGRQEIRKRRRPSQPMVDKSQQTEVMEKKKQFALPPSSGPKTTVSIGHIPGCKSNYGAKEYESIRISSQLQQTWMKRRHGHEMIDRSLQTDNLIQEEKEVKLTGETVAPEERGASAGEAAAELQESVQEAEIPSSRHSIHQKIDRSQQTSCTGDWTTMNIPPKEKVDKGQQTSFTEAQMVAISRPSNSLTSSNQGAQKCKPSGEIFPDEPPELQPATSSYELIRQENVSMCSLTQETGNDTVIPLPDKSRQEVPVEEEGSYGTVEMPQVQKALSTLHLSTVEDPFNEAEPPSVEEAIDKGELSPAEETPVQLQPPPEEIHADEPPGQKPLPEEYPAELQLSPDNASPVEIQAQPTEYALEDISATLEPAEIQSPAPEEIPEEGVFAEEEDIPAQSPSAKDNLEEAPAEGQSPPAEDATAEERPAEKGPTERQSPEAQEALAEMPPPLVEEVPRGELNEDVKLSVEEDTAAQSLSAPASEAPTQEASAEVQSTPPNEVPAEVVPVEEAPDEIQPPLAEETPAEEALAEAPPPPAEEAAAEVDQVEQGPSEVQPPSNQEASAEEGPAEVLLPPGEGASVEEPYADLPTAPRKEIPAGVQSPATRESHVEEASADRQSPPAAGVAVEEWPEGRSPSAEHVLAEEAAIEEVSAEVQEVPQKEAPTKIPTPPVEEAFIKEIYVQDQPSSEQKSADEALVESVLAELQFSLEADIAGEKGSSDARADPKSDDISLDFSNAEDIEIPSLEVEGVIRVEIKNAPPEMRSGPT
ncbi:LOW QUALITY PROTEIN: fibrous sheath CABYR-binding protein [Ochotona curzoniae]|uniref:LOW QUALITY PROTEIN: fibrous sheath CABYR-binding protein n=1 Tax=Ochotona curzoniae TaxID=130825 RepID=UPI001B351268|nr:LOW QUALITY PROTEIN: fibrous sheath CABYR-binding protein [Ochotona curzoniae]